MWQLKLFSGTARYSVLEKELFDAVVKTGKDGINTKDLVYVRLKLGPWDVKHPRNIISTIMSTLAEKIERNHEPFMLKYMRRGGARGTEMRYWVESRSDTKVSRAQWKHHAADAEPSLFD